MDRFEKEIRWPTVVWVARRTHMGSHRVKTRLSTLGMVLSLMAACNPSAAPGSSVCPHFPQQRDSEGRVLMDARIEGELVIEHGCIRVKKIDGA